jgi:hypothetical protein
METLTPIKHELLIDIGKKQNTIHKVGENQMKDNQKYAFVLDSRGIILSPTKSEKAWYKIRHGKAKLVSQSPLTIQLEYQKDNTDNSNFHIGLDTGEITGIAVVQECETKKQVVFKGEIHHRKDVSKKMTGRADCRKLRRQEKRYRKPRFNNRNSSKRQSRLAPSIKTSKDEIIRVVMKLKRLVNIIHAVIEDIAFDIRALTDGYKPYRWKYQESNRLDENLRKACLIRDSLTCQMCEKQNCRLEAHHVNPKRNNGENTIGNLITLCEACHESITGNEYAYMEQFYTQIGGVKNTGLKYASHVMLGKTYLKSTLVDMGLQVSLTNGGTTANRRIDWAIEKKHSNDAVCITGLMPETVSVYEWTIKPLRKKRQTKIDGSKEIVQGDRVQYIRRKKTKILGYVVAILENGKCAGMYKLKDYTGKLYGPVSINSLKKVSSEAGLSFL